MRQRAVALVIVGTLLLGAIAAIAATNPSSLTSMPETSGPAVAVPSGTGATPTSSPAAATEPATVAAGVSAALTTSPVAPSPTNAPVAVADPPARAVSARPNPLSPTPDIPSPALALTPGTAAPPGPGAGAGVAPGALADPGSQLLEPLSSWGPPPAPLVDPRRFTEAHWQGLEVIPKTPLVAQALGISPEARGVIADDVTLPADLQGFQAGDLVTQIEQAPTPDLTSFIGATEAIRDRRQAAVTVVRNGETRNMVLTALLARLGNANGETPSMIPPGARMPHPYRGPCTNCHRIGTTGTLAVDQGDLITKTAPTIRAGSVRPHRDRGPCLACHQVTP